MSQLDLFRDGEWLPLIFGLSPEEASRLLAAGAPYRGTYLTRGERGPFPELYAFNKAVYFPLGDKLVFLTYERTRNRGMDPMVVRAARAALPIERLDCQYIWCNCQCECDPFGDDPDAPTCAHCDGECECEVCEVSGEHFYCTTHSTRHDYRSFSLL